MTLAYDSNHIDKRHLYITNHGCFDTFGTNTSTNLTEICEILR